MRAVMQMIDVLCAFLQNLRDNLGEKILLTRHTNGYGSSIRYNTVSL
jgi:hypothetical protein